MSDCSSVEAVFDPTDTKKLPKFPVQLIVILKGGIEYCLREKDIPKDIDRLYGSGGFKSSGLYPGYFGRKIEAVVAYSNKGAAKSGLRDIPADRIVTDESGTRRINEWYGFDFPALQSRIKDVGSLTINEAFNGLSLQLAQATDVVEIFGLKLSIRAFLVVTLLALPLLNMVFLGGLKQHGVNALPEALQGLPKSLIAVTVFGVVCLLPSVGLYLTAERLSMAIPSLAALFPMIAISWMVASVVALTLVSRAVKRKS